MDEQSGEPEEKEVMGEGIGESKMENWYQNDVNEETKGAKTTPPKVLRPDQKLPSVLFCA